MPETAPYVWQETIWESLVKALRKHGLPHALLLDGERNIGKTDFTRALAKLILCRSPADSFPCGACQSCSMIDAGTHPDRLEIASGGNHVSIKVDDIRLLSSFSQRSSHSGAARIAIIPEAHLMNISASNALLKTLEEPQDQVFIILTSSEPGRLSATVRSRVQRIKMRLPTLEEIKGFVPSQLEKGSTSEFLRLSKGKPFVDDSQLSDFGTPHYQNFQECVLETLLGKKTSVELQKHAVKLTPHLAVDEFFLIAAEILKSLFIESKNSVEKSYFSSGQIVSKEEILNIYFEENSDFKKRQFSKSLAGFIASVESTQKNMKSNSNPNPQLLLDSLIWRWQRLGSFFVRENSS